jgi:hypothetical protein
VPRSRKVELYHHSPICPHGMVLPLLHRAPETVCGVNITCLMLFWKIIAKYSQNHMPPINAEFFMLKQAVLIFTTVLYRV